MDQKFCRSLIKQVHIAYVFIVCDPWNIRDSSLQPVLRVFHDRYDGSLGFEF